MNLKATANWDGVKEHRIQKVRSGLLDVSKHAHWVRLRLLVSNKHAWKDTLAALEATTREDIQVACQKILSESHLEALVEGNLSVNAAAAMCKCAKLIEIPHSIQECPCCGCGWARAAVEITGLSSKPMHHAFSMSELFWRGLG